MVSLASPCGRTAACCILMLVANLLVGMAIPMSFDVGERIISELRLNYGWGEDGVEAGLW